MTKSAAQALALTLKANHMAPQEIDQEVTILAYDPTGEMDPEKGYSLIWNPEMGEWEVFNALEPDRADR